MDPEPKIRHGIRRKLLTTMIGLIVSLLAILTYFQINAQKQILERELVRRIDLKREILTQLGQTLSDNLARQAENDIAAFNFSNLTERIKNAVRDNDELAYIILMDSDRIAHVHTMEPTLQEELLSLPQDIFAGEQTDKPAINEFRSGSSAIMEFIVPLRISTTPWGVLRFGFSLDQLNQEIDQSRREIAGQTQAMITRSSVTLFIFILIGTVVILYESNQIAKPLISLTETAKQLATGNFQAASNITVSSKDEIGVLASAFVTMSEDLKVSYDKLEEYSRTLEEKVEHRTKELKGANELLQRTTNAVQLLQEVATAANEASSFRNAAQTAIDRICAYTSWPVGHLYLPDKDASDRLLPTKIWHLDDPGKVKQFQEVTEVTPFTIGIGLPGRVLESKKPEWISDVTKDTNFPRATLVSEIGVRGAFAFPVMAGPDVAAVLEFFSSDVQSPDEGLLELMANIGTSLGRVIERENAEQKIIATNTELTGALENLKEAQGRLVESEKMASLGGLVAGIAHEINTPVGVGVTAASLLEEKTTSFLDLYQQGAMKRSDLEKFLDTSSQTSRMISSNLNRAAELIHSFKQVAVDQSSEEKRTFKVREYIEEIVLSLRPKLKKADHQIEIDCDETIQVDSYPGAFAQIITNLLLNSLIHAYDVDDRGLLSFNVTATPTVLNLIYSDDGKGIAKEHQDKIFEPFFTTRRGQGGSGLGMHLVYNLVTQKLKGEITCESEPGAGTAFRIKLPLQLKV